MNLLNLKSTSCFSLRINIFIYIYLYLYGCQIKTSWPSGFFALTSVKPWFSKYDFELFLAMALIGRLNDFAKSINCLE